MTQRNGVSTVLTCIVAGLGIVFYPLVLIPAALHTLYKMIFGKTQCKSVAGDVAVVTGAAHGLGKAISVELAQRGCHIAVVDINIELAEKTAQEISETYNVKAKAYKVDVSNNEEVIELNEMVTKDLGAATILINNAGVLLISDPLNPDYKEVQRMINVNLTAHFWTNRVFLPHMKSQKRGHIVAISSLSCLFPLMYNAEYTSTKCAVRGMMRVLRQELKYRKYDDIIATTVCPTFLQTNDEVVNLLHSSGIDRLAPIVTGEEAAACIVSGMLQNKREILIPNFLSLFYRFNELLPAEWQDWIAVAPYMAIANKYNTTVAK